MRKRLLSVLVAVAMMFSSFATVAMAATLEDLLHAPINMDAIRDEEAAFIYEGNRPLITAEKILDELNADATTAIFDQTQHQDQLTVIETAHTAVSALNEIAFAASIAHLTTDMTDYQKKYLICLVKAYDENDATIKAALENPAYDITELGLRYSFGRLNEYRNYMAGVFTANGILETDYPTYEVRAAKYVAEPIIAFANIFFSELGSEAGGMRDTYVTEFLTVDRAKKTFSVLFGEALTEEVISDSVTSHKGIVRHVKNYVLANPAVITEIKTDLETVLDPNSVRYGEACDLLGELIYEAYDACATCGDSIRDDVAMLMGDGTNTGLFEQMLIDMNQVDAYNTWINLFLSEFVQMTSAAGRLNTISAATPNPAARIIANGTSVSFEFENLEAYGIGANVALPNDYFDVVCYYDDGTVNSNVTYDSAGGKMSVVRDNTKDATYEGYITIYRVSESGSQDTFVESYPVIIRNFVSGGSGSVTRYVLTYETNGGSAIAAENHAEGKVVELTKTPVKEGYIFTGWYLDEALTQPVTSVVMNSNITVYAGWVKDGSTVVSKVPVPEKLNGDDHYAYIMGYPDGTIQPEGNITRAETVTIIFRLLEDEIRDGNLTTENAFTDVNEGDWFNAAVSTLASLGIVEGRTETEFMPNAKITRAEFSTIVARFADFGYEKGAAFTDVDGHWAEEYIYEAAAYGWIAGYEDNTFRPDRFITRAEAMTLTNRVLKRIPENKEALLDGMTEWIDNMDTSAWYYIAVQEATNSHDFERKNESFEIWKKITEARDWTEYED